LFLLRAIHLRQSFRQPPAGTTQNGNGHLQIALEFYRSGPADWRLPLRFQKQFRLGEDALANCWRLALSCPGLSERQDGHAPLPVVRAIAPGAIQLSGLPRVTTVFNESGSHSLAMVHVDSRHRHHILHGQLRRDLSFAYLLLYRFRQKLD